MADRKERKNDVTSIRDLEELPRFTKAVEDGLSEASKEEDRINLRLSYRLTRYESMETAWCIRIDPATVDGVDEVAARIINKLVNEEPGDGFVGEMRLRFERLGATNIVFRTFSVTIRDPYIEQDLQEDKIRAEQEKELKRWRDNMESQALMIRSCAVMMSEGARIVREVRREYQEGGAAIDGDGFSDWKDLMLQIGGRILEDDEEGLRDDSRVEVERVEGPPADPETVDVELKPEKKKQPKRLKHSDVEKWAKENPKEAKKLAMELYTKGAVK